MLFSSKRQLAQPRSCQAAQIATKWVLLRNRESRCECLGLKLFPPKAPQDRGRECNPASASGIESDKGPPASVPVEIHRTRLSLLLEQSRFFHVPSFRIGIHGLCIGLGHAGVQVYDANRDDVAGVPAPRSRGEKLKVQQRHQGKGPPP